MPHTKLIKSILILIALIFNFSALPVIAVNNTFYVDASIGNDANSGTSEDSALESIIEASSRVQAGDTVLVKNGTYFGRVDITQSGTSTNWITFKNFPGHSPKIINDQTGVYDAVMISGNYIEINGFDIEEKGLGSGIYIFNETTGNHHINIFNNTVHDAACGGIASRYADYITIQGNITYNNGFTSPYMCSGISLYQSVNYDQQAGFHNIISNNITYNNFNKDPWGNQFTTDGNGIIIDDLRHTQPSNFPVAYTGSTLIENNISFNNGGRGIHAFQSDNVTIRNNTTFHNVQDPYLDGTYNAELTTYFSSNISFYNNIAIPSAGKLNYIDAYSTGNKWDRNLFGNIDENIGDQSDAIFGTGNVFSADPKFVNPSENSQIANFRLLPDSPAIDKATTNYPLKDYSGTSRPQGASADIGAFEYSNTQNNSNSGGLTLVLSQDLTKIIPSKPAAQITTQKEVSLPATQETLTQPQITQNPESITSTAQSDIPNVGFKFLDCKDKLDQNVNSNGTIVNRVPKGAVVIFADESGIIIAQSREYYRCVAKVSEKVKILSCKDNMGYILDYQGRRVRPSKSKYTVKANQYYGRIFTSKNTLISCTSDYRP